MYKIDRRGGGWGGSKNRILGNYPTFFKILLNFSRTPLSCKGVGGGLKVHIFKQVQRIERLIFLF